MKDTIKKIQQEAHPHCILCGHNNRKGLKLNFQLFEDGIIETSIKCSKSLQGYKNIVHGGVLSALFDSAMINCLFAHGIKALTAELRIRFIQPVNIQQIIRLRANIEKSYGHFYMLKAELFQNNVKKARAIGRFIACSQTEFSCKGSAFATKKLKFN